VYIYKGSKEVKQGVFFITFTAILFAALWLFILCKIWFRFPTQV